MSSKSKFKQKHQKSRSLASRKRHKDVSSAMFENTSFEREADRLSIEPLKAGFDTALPRSFREMQKQIQLMKDAEAGKPVKRYVPHEDMPRPNQPREKFGGKKSKAKNDAAAQGVSNSQNEGGSKDEYAFANSFVDRNKNKQKGGGEGQGDKAAAGKKRKLEEPVDEASEAGLPRFHESSRAKARKDFPRAEPVKFGSTNDAPPTLLVGGHLKKVANAARAGAAKADALARQRAAAIQAYAEAKKKRRLEERSS